MTASFGSTTPRVIVKAADVDEYEIAAYCPVCEQRVDDREGVHEVPAGVVDVSVQDVAADGGEAIDLYGYRCDRHRDPFILPAPASIAPPDFERVELEIGDDLEAATPRQGDRR